MYKTILVPIDDGACRELLLTHSVGLAKLCQAELTFLHVLKASDTKDERTRAEKLLSEATARAQMEGVQAKTRLVVGGSAVDTILLIEEAYDLIIIATHGRQGADRLVLGSVSEGIIRRSRKPHLVLRCEAEDTFDLVDLYRQSGEEESF